MIMYDNKKIKIVIIDMSSKLKIIIFFLKFAYFNYGQIA